jgi:hypothetical protein
MDKIEKTGLDYRTSVWLSKVCRGSWSYDSVNNEVNVEGNIFIHDNISRLPIKFGTVNGDIHFSNCALSSIVGIPKFRSVTRDQITHTPECWCTFENCLFPEEVYQNAILCDLTLEEYLGQNISTLSESVLTTLIETFPNVAEEHRGEIVGNKFGF